MVTPSPSAVQSPSADEIPRIPRSLDLVLHVDDPHTVSTLAEIPSGLPRESYALRALQIGVLAMDQARSRVDVETIRREGTRILEVLEERLRNHKDDLQDRVNRTLADYFDPTTGRFHERVQRLVQRDGELERVLRASVGSEGSQLAATLAQHVGRDSLLMRRLDPASADGLLSGLTATFHETLDAQREAVFREFSLDNADGALSRLVEELQQRHGKMQTWMSERLETVVGEFSLDKPDSALSRLVGRVDHAQSLINAEFSLDNESSALSRLARQLEDTRAAVHRELTLDSDDSSLSRLRKELLTLVHSQGQKADQFHAEVTRTLAEIAARRHAEARSTTHGHLFEEAVCAQVQLRSGEAGDLFDATGTTIGRIAKCKVGDGVIELGPDSVAPGARVALEAKDMAGFTVAKARTEIELARKNRDAGVGLFVFARTSAPRVARPLWRLGADVFVIWDQDDPTSDIVLDAGIELARALAIRQAKVQSQHRADVNAMEEALLEIERRVEGLAEIEKWSTTIHSNSKKILLKLEEDRAALAEHLAGLRGRIEVLAAEACDGGPRL